MFRLIEPVLYRASVGVYAQYTTALKNSNVDYKYMIS